MFLERNKKSIDSFRLKSILSSALLLELYCCGKSNAIDLHSSRMNESARSSEKSFFDMGLEKGTVFYSKIETDILAQTVWTQQICLSKQYRLNKYA